MPFETSIVFEDLPVEECRKDRVTLWLTGRADRGNRKMSEYKTENNRQ
jgi:hypothetical protein